MKNGCYLLLLITCGLLLFFLPGKNIWSDEGYVGTDACRACHGDIHSEFVKNVHGKKTVPDSPANREGCESCHGPGSGHVSAGGGKGVAIISFAGKEGAKQRSSKCLGCHEDLYLRDALGEPAWQGWKKIKKK
ncbi:MAG: hypothetical protein AB1390_01115 [Nitrospirota bacterium]